MMINWEVDSMFLCKEQTEAEGFAKQQKTSMAFVRAAITCIASYPQQDFSVGSFAEKLTPHDLAHKYDLSFQSQC